MTLKQHLSETVELRASHISAELSGTPPVKPTYMFGKHYSDKELTDAVQPTNSLSQLMRDPQLAPAIKSSSAIHCRHCNCPSIVHSDFPTVQPVKENVMFCPLHGRVAYSTKIDAYDSYAVTSGLPKSQVVQLMVQTKQIMQQATQTYTKHRKPTIEQAKYSVKKNKIAELNNIDWLERLMNNMPSYGSTTVHIKCNACLSLSTLTISNKVNNLGVNYCPHCGEKSVTITQSEPNHTIAFEALAEKYNIHPWYAESLYTLWATSYTQYPTFDAFMQTLPERMTREAKDLNLM